MEKRIRETYVEGMENCKRWQQTARLGVGWLKAYVSIGDEITEEEECRGRYCFKVLL